MRWWRVWMCNSHGRHSELPRSGKSGIHIR